MRHEKVLNGASRNSSSPSPGSHMCLMARDSKVTSTLEPNTSCDDEDEDNEEEDDGVFALHDMGEIVYRAICKDKISRSNFIDILTFAMKNNEIIEKLEAQDE